MMLGRCLRRASWRNTNLVGSSPRASTSLKSMSACRHGVSAIFSLARRCAPSLSVPTQTNAPRPGLFQFFKERRDLAVTAPDDVALAGLLLVVALIRE